MFMILALLVALAGQAVPGLTSQKAAAAPLYNAPTTSVTVPAGGSALLQVSALGYQRGAAIPQGPITLAPQSLPDNTVRTALYYGLDWGYAATDPQQVAYAAWWARDGQWPSEDHAVAERIASAAGAAPGLPSWNPDGRSALGLVSQGQLTLSPLQLTPSSLSPAAGSGVLQVSNTSPQDLVVYLPYGTLFMGTSGSALVWATGVAQGQPTPAPTAPAATATPVPEASPTETGGYKQGYTPSPEATATESVKAPPAATATEVPTSAPAPEPPAATATAAPQAPQPPSVPAQEAAPTKAPPQ